VRRNQLKGNVRARDCRPDPADVIRTLLTTIHGVCQLLSDRLPKSLIPSAKTSSIRFKSQILGPPVGALGSEKRQGPDNIICYTAAIYAVTAG